MSAGGDLDPLQKQKLEGESEILQQSLEKRFIAFHKQNSDDLIYIIIYIYIYISYHIYIYIIYIIHIYIYISYRYMYHIYIYHIYIYLSQVILSDFMTF